MGSKKPCPGCGEVDTRRRASDVCPECKFKLSHYGVVSKELAEVKKVLEDRGVEKVDFIIPFEAREGERRKFQIVAEVIDSMGGYAVKGFNPYALLRGISDLSNDRYEEGVRYGTNLLKRLNDGTLSLEDFNHLAKGKSHRY